MKSKATGKKVAIALLVVFSCMAAVMFFLAFGVTEMGKVIYDESNTIEYAATYQRMEEAENKKGYLVYFDEYDFSFHLLKATVISYDNLEKLEAGTSVTIRIWDMYEEVLEKSEAENIPLVTFKAGVAEIVSFESSNREEESGRTKAKITGIVAAVGFLVGALVCVIMLVKVSKKN